MKTLANKIMDSLASFARPEKAAFLPRFFKCGEGQYGEGDQFIGVMVPDARRVAKTHEEADAGTLLELLLSPVHEHRLTALLILVLQFKKRRGDDEREAIVNFYIEHVDRVNNWDLVDLSCYNILGPWLEHRDRGLLHDWARSGHLWRQRVAMVTCMHFARGGDSEGCFAIADILLHHPHDLIHKAVGWILREVGKRDRPALDTYLLPRYRQMPRTMLRYAIERHDAAERRAFLAGTRGDE
ncbi:MAG: DNA alkylation repair protein [Odoribacteraceae bacterium]|jgi:3-methyladenine DNA glycosylase AlkD|nr:DNA alkylation repair protein [Odoribacteraceae bacterium]